MTISPDTPIKKNLVLILKEDQVVDGEIFPKNQYGQVIAGGKRIATVRLHTTKHEDYEVVFDLNEVRASFNLAPMIDNSDLTDWTCKLTKSNQDGVERKEYILRHKKEIVGNVQSVGGRLISSNIDHDEWRKLVLKTYENCQKITAFKIRPFGVSKAEAEGILCRYIDSPLKNYMSLDEIVQVEMAKRDAVFGQALTKA